MDAEMLQKLAKPFHPSQVIWKPGAVKGARALALAYADLRAYMNRLDEVCGSDWSVAYEPWGADRLICRLTILGVMRSSTGETTNEAERSEIGGTVAEAQAFKRACAMFGLGRYLYNLPTGWADYDPASKKFTEAAKAKLMGILVQHYRRATEPQPSADQPPADNSYEDVDYTKAASPHQRLWAAGLRCFGADDWDMARPWLIGRWTARESQPKRTSAADLADGEKERLATYIGEKCGDLKKVWPRQKAIMLQSTN